jgi:5'-nucleotidase
MPDLPLDLSGARILLSNDDGIHSPGLEVLEKIALSLSDDVWVVAPETEQSGASHSLTLHRPLRLRRIAERRFAVDGTPTDCVLLAINHILKDRRPDLVLSGINNGSNIGEDVTYSGTIAAAMEATLLGVPAMALSQHLGAGEAARWDTPLHWGPGVIRRAVSASWPRNVLINVVRHGKRKISDDLTERVDPRGRAYFWIGALRGEEDVLPGTDINVVIENGIAVTPLELDLTHYPTLETLRSVFA